MHITKVLQDGYIFAASALDQTPEAILAKFQGACRNMAALSLGAGYPTTASAPHSIINGFKNLVGACAASGYTFPKAAALLDAAKKGPAPGAAKSGATAAEAAPAKEEPKEEEADPGMGNLFGDDEDDY